ncbi:hypothetical protein TNCV_1456491 [Trichonephila clavipes]|nr:hypothetical protein TNCV_1456491 [Trichonephila clavipes]
MRVYVDNFGNLCARGCLSAVNMGEPSPYDLKESRSSWSALQQSSAAACYPYDPSGLATCASYPDRTATADSDVVQSGRPIFDDFFQHLWPYIGNNTANVVFQMVKRLWLIRIDQ